ncbi:hypothetical protein I4U23_031491 [Adineta vaga]|nr:hypothetical protein I4U23_031491 [Adineta vaga]
MKWIISNCNTSSCLSEVRIDRGVITTLSELFIPAQSLAYGTYELKLTVTMTAVPNLISSASTYVKMVPSNIQANLVQFGTSMITQGHQQNLTLNPDKFSVDPDTSTFNASNWQYTYYCRIYGLYNFPSINGTQLPIDDPRIDLLNSSCFSNRSGNETAWEYGSTKSSVTILAESLVSNKTYQFMVIMINRENSSIQATGYLLVQVQDQTVHTVTVGCVISTMCMSNMEYQSVNPTTQVALFSICNDNCSSLSNITWNIYEGLLNSSSNIVKWTRFNSTIAKKNIWFFGMNTSNLTSTTDLFIHNPQIKYWSFEVIYSFVSEISSSAINFVISQPLQNGSCSINPLNGTTSTLFTISCLNWFGQTDIQDYSFYAGDDNKYNISTIVVLPDSNKIATLIDVVQEPGDEANSDSLVQLLASSNQNIVGQILTSLSLTFNKMSSKNVELAVTNGIPAATISVSPLDGESQQMSSAPLNISALVKYNQKLNSYANMIASTKCYQLALALQAMALKISYEDVQAASTSIAQCVTNVLTVRIFTVNIPLQERGNVLDLDLNRANAFPADYDTDIEYIWSNLKMFANGDDFSWETIQTGRNTYYQMQTANTIAYQVIETLSLITSAVNIHLNIDQHMTVNTSSVFLSLETLSISSLRNKIIQPFPNSQIQIPSIFNLTVNNNVTVFLRTIMQPLASTGASHSHENINMSTSISLSIIDQNGNDIEINTNINDPIQFIIPRDINLIVSPMFLQNVTSIDDNHNQIFNLHYINITQLNKNLSVSLHFEMDSLNKSLAYLLIYRFDDSPQLNSSINQIDGWSLFCPLNLTKNDTYTYFIDNQRTSNHQSVIFGIRELNTTESYDFCSNNSLMNISIPISNKPYKFSSNYKLRTYTSGCYYLDSNNNWQSDGLLVGPLTNHYQTYCLSTHLTTFTSGFIILPEPINWNYIFANTSFSQNKIIYLTRICICIIYLLLIIYDRYKNKKDIEKLEISDNYKVNQYFYEMIVLINNYSNCNYNHSLQVSYFFLNIYCLSNNYTKILTIDKYWKWLEDSFISNIRAQQWYNDNPHRNLSVFINERSNRLIGWTIMRQLRIKSDSCQVTESYSSSIRQAFIYQSSNKLNTFIYVGDYVTYGDDRYIYEFHGSLSNLKSNLLELHQLEWIDKQTRAVIIQINLNNRNVEIFMSVTYLVEFLSSINVFPSARFESIYL